MSKIPQAANSLGQDYMRRVAEDWPKLPHAQEIIEHLPEEVDLMLRKQSDEFLRGFANAITLTHDLGIKALLHEMIARTGGVAADPRDVLLTKVGSIVEGCCYLACKEFMGRKDQEKGQS